ncbi:MAG: hypothetical protein KDA84_03715 [Planctomycetaceae bacterium]|nr:hypothetical protein [Planctomycetaceae bacterium]
MKRSISFPTCTAQNRRSGAFLIIAMICLLLASALLGTLLRMASIERQQAHLEARALQAEWLAESALDRAAAKLSADASYKGETWTVTAKELGGMDEGNAVIRVVPSDNSGKKLIEVVAHYPTEAPQTIRRSKQIRYSRPRSTTKTTTKPIDPATAEKPKTR